MKAEAMGSQGPKSSSSKPSKPSNTTNPNPRSSSTSSSSLSTHLAMVELKQRILTSLSKLSDRDTHQIALEELESTIASLQTDAVPMLLNTLFDASSSDPKPAVKKHAVRLIASLCAAHPDATSTHLVKIVSHISKRLRDPDSGVRDACRDAFGSLSAVYIDGATGDSNAAVVSLFMKPLLEALGENDKGVQIGAAMCLGRVVECAKNPPVLAFHKLGSRVCKYLHSPNFFAKSALLPVISIMSQMGAIAPQSLDSLLQSVHECLGSSDWATRKAAAETLSSLALHSSHLVKDNPEPTLTALESCRFDKIKPVRDTMVEALQYWKKIAGKGGDGPVDEPKSSSHEKSGSSVLSDKSKQKSMDTSESKAFKKDSSDGDSSISDSAAKRSGNISDRTVGLLKKKVPALNDKELNPEFFQKLEKRGSDDLPVEVVVSRKCPNSSNANEDEPEQNDAEDKGKADRRASSIHSRQDLDVSAKNRGPDSMINGKEPRTRALEIDDKNAVFSKSDAQSDGSFASNKGNWLAIQRQLLHLERQQTHLMNMLQDFMGGSHDSMVSLESRVRGLERVVEDMVQDLSLSSGRRGNNFMSGLEGSSSRNPSRYGFYDYNGKFGRGGDGKFHFSNGISSGMRGRNPSRRSEPPDSWEFNSYGAPRAGTAGSINHMDGRSPRSEPETDHIGSRRAWEKGVGPVRLGEGPSARSVWQASKDEATLAAIRGAGEDNGTTARAPRVAIPEMTAEAMGNDNNEQHDPVWTAWSNAMDAVHAGDIDSAYAEVISIGDDFLLVKLMDRSGPALDQLSNEIAVEVLNSISQLLMEQNLFDLCLSWIQQLADFVMENGPDVFEVPKEIRRELLFNFHHVSSNIDLPEDWEGATPDQLMMHLASAWNINLQHGN